MASADELPLKASATAWLPAALANIDALLQDHLHCERKAAQSALSLLRSYPERTDIVVAMARLAHEETAHVVQVAHVLERRAVTATKDFGDEYAAALARHIRRGEPARCLDRLLVFAVIEGRSAERLGLIAAHWQRHGAPERLADLYATLAAAERRHCELFLGLAAATSSEWRVRAQELAMAEADILATLPMGPRIH